MYIKISNKTGLLLWLCLIGWTRIVPASAQQNPADKSETDPLVLKKLDWFRDAKFGLMMHWGTYSQWGIVESWSLCSEDEPWCIRSIDDYEEYKRQYENLKTTFNPTNGQKQPDMPA